MLKEILLPDGLPIPFDGKDAVNRFNMILLNELFIEKWFTPEKPDIAVVENLTCSKVDEKDEDDGNEITPFHFLINLFDGN